MSLPYSDFTGFKTEHVAPAMESNESLRRILFLLNEIVVSSGVPVMSLESEGESVTGRPITAGKDDLGIARYLRTDHLGRLQIDLQASDIQIGAVEIKDAATDERVSVSDNKLQVLDASLVAQVDIKSSELRDAIRGSGAKTLTDVSSDLGIVNTSVGTVNTSINTKLDITLSALRDAIRGGDSKTLSDVESSLDSILSALSNKSLFSKITDGTNDLLLKTADPATNSVAIPVRNIPSGTQNVAVTSSALPTGAATETALQSILTELQSKTEPANQQHVIVDSSALPAGAATQTTLASVDGKLPTLVASRVPVDGSGVIQPISAASLPLPGAGLGDPYSTAASEGEMQVQTGWLNSIGSNGVGFSDQTVATDDTGTWTVLQLMKRLLSRVTVLISGLVASSSGNASITTSSTGSNWVTLTSQACKRVIVVNNCGTSIDVRQGGAGTAIPVLHTMIFVFDGLSNASDLSLKRTDSSNTTATVLYRWEA